MNDHLYRTPDAVALVYPRSRDLPIAPKWNPDMPSDTPDAVCAGGIPFQGRRIHVDVAAIGDGEEVVLAISEVVRE